MGSSLHLLLVGAFESFESSRLRFLAPQLGIERLAAYIRKHGFSVQTTDPNIDGNTAFYQYIHERKPQVIGFSISYVTLLNDLSLIHYANEKSPHSLLIAGGQQATFEYKALFKILPIDLIILGEGEIPVLEIMKARENKQDLFKINGTVHNKNNKITRVGNNEPLTSGQFRLVNLGIDFSKIDYRKYWLATEKFYDKPNYAESRTIRLFTINYCPFSCTYCSSRTFLNFAKGSVDELCNPRGNVTKLVGLTAEEMIQLVSNALSAYPGTHRFYLQDDEHFLIKGRVEEFCSLILKKKKELAFPDYLEFMCQSRVDDVNLNLLRLIKKAGYSLIAYGVESFSEKMLKSIKKTSNVTDIHNALNWTIQAGLKPFANLILFLPEITKKDLLITIDNALDYIKKGVEIATEPFVLPLPGSTLYYSEEYKQHKEVVQIAGTNEYIERTHFVIPKEKDMAELAFAFFKTQQKHLDSLSLKYKFKHLPTRLRSLTTFHTILSLIKDDARCMKTEKLLSQI